MAAAKKTLTAGHKEALAQGRESARAVRTYLDALEAHKPKRGRRRTPESIRTRLAAIETTYADESPINRLQLAQERMDLTAELEVLEADNNADLSDLEAAFVKHAQSYGERKGITYQAWREIGVDPKVLKAAGISRSTR